MSTTMMEPAACAAPDGITTIGLAKLMSMAYRGEDFTPTWNGLAARLEHDATDAAALMDMSTILQLTGQRDRGLQFQQVALQISRLYRRPHGRGDGLKVLAFVVAGDFMANTPLDFLFEGSDFELHLLYLQLDGKLPDELPEHDVCFLAISESQEHQGILGRIQDKLATLPRPVVNGAADRIAALSRDGVCALFEHDPGVVVAKTVRCERSALEGMRETSDLSRLLPGEAFPIIVRPVGTHAGAGLSKLDGLEELRSYLQERREEEFYLAPFIDYRSPDGLFRKQRIAFIGGKAFISHMAISDHWMVHYLSAGMEESNDKRAEEAHFFEQFDTEFAVRHRAAFESLHRRIGLDYFGIDCAELPDGRLLVFEVDVAMIVHSLDPEHLYPYKRPAMARLFAGFQASLEAAAAQS
ncbi:MAG TPA: hypothetical protein VE650_20325 [Acetobacteraceae bacterium]|nr:hypothetical protein [Acetobacteraceae bacterium]